MNEALLNLGTPGLHRLDWVVIIAYLVLVLGMGWHYSRQQSSSREYFIAGLHHIHPVLVGISLYATLLSTISYLGKPGEMINKGPVLLIGQIVSIPFAYLIVSHWIIPCLMQQRVTSAYELLERRLGLGVRLLGAIMFVGLRLVWMGLLIYMSSNALAVIMGWELSSIPAISIVTGLVAVIYTSMGGLRTVVLTDLFQFGLLLLGGIVTIVLISIHLRGFSWWPTAWSPYWDQQPWFSADPHTRVTVFGATIAMLLWRVATVCGDQTAVQRFMATRDTAAARRSYLVNSIATLVVTALLALLGLALLGFFSRFPESLGPGMTLQKSADHLFPHFIAHFLPTGIAGLVVAAVVAAAMSSVDSGVNAITAVVMRDFLERFHWQPRSDQASVRFSQWMAFAIGLLIVLLSLLMQRVPGNFMQMTSTTASLITTPIFVLFILALWVPFATPVGALLGCAYGVATAFFIAFWPGLTGGRALSFQWIGPGALAVNLAVALSVSRWGPARDNRCGSLHAGLGGMVALLVIIVGLTW